MTYTYQRDKEIKKMFTEKMQKWDEKATHIRVAQSMNIAVELVSNYWETVSTEACWEKIKELVPKIHRDLYWLQKEGVELEQREEEKAEEALRDAVDDDDSEVASTLTLKEE